MIQVYIGAALVAIAVYGAYYVNNLQSTVSTLSAANAALTQASETNQQTINELERSLVVQQELSAKLTSDLQSANTAKTKLLEKLQRHDLAKLAARKPKLIEDRVNAATKDLFNELELITTN